MFRWKNSCCSTKFQQESESLFVDAARVQDNVEDLYVKEHNQIACCEGYSQNEEVIIMI